MKKISVLLCIYFFSLATGFSQPTQAEMAQKIKFLKLQKSDITAFPLAPRNLKLLNCLPIRTFTRYELVPYLHNLNSVIADVLRNGYKIDIADIALTRAGTTIGLWINREPEKPVLVTLKVAGFNPDNKD